MDSSKPRRFPYDLSRTFLGFGKKKDIELELRADGALVPNEGSGADTIFLKYTDILDVKLHEFPAGGGDRSRMLTIEARTGKGVMQARRFASEGRFDDFANDLAARVQAARIATSAGIATSVPRPEPSPPPPAPVPAAVTSAGGARPAEPPISEQQQRFEQSLLDAIAAQRPSDPYIGAKIAGQEVFARLMSWMKDGKGVHAPSLLSALGAIAGHACQASVRAQAIAAGKPPESYFMVVTTKDGGNYLLSECINELLITNKVSVWSLAGGAAQHLGVRTLPDVLEIVEHSMKVLGSPAFGVPRLPPDMNTSAPPAEYAAHLWPKMRPMVEKLTGNPKQWAMAIGFAIQDAIRGVKDAMPPDVALKIVMESAVPVTRIPIRD